MQIHKVLTRPLFMMLAVLFLTTGSGYYLYQNQSGPSSQPRSVPGGFSDLGPSTDNDPAFYDVNYKAVSPLALSKVEHTVVYEYKDDPNNENYLQYFSPCGTLMTQFSDVGSVRVGRGPVYTSALNECKMVNSSYIPNDFSFRSYACENFAYTPAGSNESHIVGRATFAFQCSPANEDTKCSEARINGSTPQKDWNCSNIVH